MQALVYIYLIYVNIEGLRRYLGVDFGRLGA